MKKILIAFVIAVISGIIILIVQYTFFEKKDKVSPVKVELSTNKGNSIIDLYNGDTLKLYIKTNQECYIRLIYLMADKSNVLATRIRLDKVNLQDNSKVLNLSNFEILAHLNCPTLNG